MKDNNWKILLKLQKDIEKLSGNVGQELIIDAIRQLLKRLNYDFAPE